MRKKTVRGVGWGMVFSVLAVFTATAGGKGDESALKERAAAYWEAWRINDLHTVYTMETAKVEGRLTPDQMRQAQFALLHVVGYKFREVKIEGDTAEIVVETQLTRPELKGKTFSGPPKKDYWTFLKGEWYHGQTAEAQAASRAKAAAEQKQRNKP